MNQKVLGLLVATAFSAIAQQIYGQAIVVGQDFEGAEFPPQGWSVLDNDNDGNGWQLASGSAYVTQYTGSKQLAVSYTREPKNYTSYGEQDNWLITPQFEVKNDQYVLQFVYAAQDLDNTEPVAVMVSEGGTSADDFKEFWSATADNGYDDEIVWSSIKRALAAYEGKTVRLAVRHKASSTYGLSIDNFYVMDQNGPVQPAGFAVKAATDGKNEITLSWTNPSKNAAGDDLTDLSIVVYRDGKFLTELSGRTPGAADTYVDEVEEGTHSYAIAAKNASGEGVRSASRSVFLGEDIPKAVGNPIALAIADGKISISWTAPAKGVNSGYFNPANLRYIVRRNGEEIARDIDGLSYIDASPVAGVNSYEVVAYNKSGESAVDDHTSAYIGGASLIDVRIAQTSERDNALARLPIDLNSKYSVSQSIYYPADFDFLTGDINELVYKVYRGVDTDLPVAARIYITSTDLDNLTTWADISEEDKVFEGTVTASQGANDIVFHLDKPFSYTGGNIVVTFVKDASAMTGSYSDRFYSMITDKQRTFTTSTYDPVDIAELPHSTYSDKSLSEIPSTRFLISPKGVASLQGTVTMSGSSDPVAGAEVAAMGYTGLVALSDAQGKYFFKYIPADVKAVSVTKVGYVDNTVEVSLSDGNLTIADVSIERNPNFTLSGKVTTDDTGLNAAGAVVSLSGYESISTTVGEDGRWSLPGVYVGKEYTIKVEYPLYNPYVAEFAYDKDGDKEYSDVVLDRALIPAWNVNATVSEDGSATVVTWNDPSTRDVVAGVKSIGDVSTQKYTGGDYYSKVFNVAHAFSEAELAAQKMVGLVVAQERVFIKASNGQFTAKVWRGTRTDNVEVASQTIPASEISADGAWVTVTFDTPAEIKPGAPYMVGVEVSGTSSASSCIGQSTASTVYDGNNIKWGDNSYSSNGYSSWCIQAVCGVPGTDIDIVENPDAPKCAYNIYRGLKGSDGEFSWALVNSTPVSGLSLTDDQWPVQVAGEYIYGVSAVYNRVGESSKALSDPIARAVDSDVAVTAFVSPVKSVDIQTKVKVEVTVTNFGELPVSAVPVSLSLNGDKALEATLTSALNKGESANLVLGEVTLTEGLNELVATAVIEGDENAANNSITLGIPNFANVNIVGYRWDAYGNAGFMQFGSNNPEAADYKVEITPNDALVIAGEAVNGTFYGFTATWWGEPREFVEIDPATWIVTRTVENTDNYVLDMAYDYAHDVMYCLATNNADVYLGTVDLTTGVVTPIGSTGLIMRTLACDLDGKLHAIDSFGKYYTVDSTSGAVTLAGDTGVGTASYLQSMAFDHNTGRLFWAHTNTAVNGDLYELDPANGKATRLGTVLYGGNDPSEIVGMYIPYKHSTSGIDTVDAEIGGDVRYYDLQGVEVKAPVNGRIYIVRRSDGTTTKQLIR